MEDLTSRQKEILKLVIDSYIDTTLPIGSRAITERHRLKLSPASVRHEMGVLEELGYLTHPHTSAGRVPTDKGYQFYVREVVKEEPVPEAAMDFISREMEGKIENLESLMERSSRVLSAMAEEAVLISTPHGSVPRVFVEGSRYILNQPEFQDLKKFQLLITTLEEKTDLIDLLTSQPHEGRIRVAIGEKELSKNIWDCSLVSAPYGLHGEYLGTVGVLGPRRMHYGRIMSLVHCMAGEISQVLMRWGS